MSQTIKFVYVNGKVRLQNTSIDLTKSVIKDLQHDYREMLPGGEVNEVKYFMLTDGEFAPERPRNQKHFNAKHR